MGETMSSARTRPSALRTWTRSTAVTGTRKLAISSRAFTTGIEFGSQSSAQEASRSDWEVVMQSAAVSLSQFIGGVDVAECFGLVVERDLDGLECSVPGVDLAPAAFEKLRQMRQDGLAHQREYRMRLVERACDRELGLVR